MKVLLACEESQTLARLFIEAGFDCISCDIKPTSGPYPNRHYVGDVRDILYESWDLIIAHPPCTYLSRSGACRLFHNGTLDADRFGLLQEAARFFYLFYNHPCEHICIENPVPFKIASLPMPTQRIQPYYFGDSFLKNTCLWLKGLPTLVPTNMLPKSSCVSYTSIHRSASVRSKSFPGIASAMFDQWSLYLTDYSKYLSTYLKMF